MSDNLPKDILTNILFRLSPKCMVKCTSVCKSWNSLITHHDFISHHYLVTNHHRHPLLLEIYRNYREEDNQYFEHLLLCTHNNNIRHSNRYPDQNRKKNNDVSFSKFPDTRSVNLHEGLNLSIVGTCNGILCLADYSVDSAIFFLWNPSINKYVTLPGPSIIITSENNKKYRVLLGFGFDRMSDDFKVVRLVTVYGDQDTLPQVEIYSLASNSWKIITYSSSSRAIPYYFTDWKLFWSPLQIYIRGVIHWVVSQKSSNGKTHKFILSFDVRKETFGELMLTKFVRELCCSEAKILQRDYCNSLVNNNKSEKDYFRLVRKSLGMQVRAGSLIKVEDPLWTKLFCFDSRCCYGCIKSIIALKSNGEVMLELLSGTIVLVDTVKKKVCHLVSRTSCKDGYVGCFVESLFLLNKNALSC